MTIMYTQTSMLTYLIFAYTKYSGRETRMASKKAVASAVLADVLAESLIEHLLASRSCYAPGL